MFFFSFYVFKKILMLSSVRANKIESFRGRDLKIFLISSLLLFPFNFLLKFNLRSFKIFIKFFLKRVYDVTFLFFFPSFFFKWNNCLVYLTWMDESLLKLKSLKKMTTNSMNDLRITFCNFFIFIATATAAAASPSAVVACTGDEFAFLFL